MHLAGYKTIRSLLGNGGETSRLSRSARTLSLAGCSFGMAASLAMKLFPAFGLFVLWLSPFPILPFP